MVTETTEVPMGTTPTSEGEPVASETTQEPTVARPQETAEKPEGTEDYIDDLKGRLGPDGLQALADRLGLKPAESARDEAEFEKAVRRKAQSLRDQERARQLETEARARKATDAKASIRDLAEKGTEIPDSLLDKFADAYAIDRFYPAVRDARDEAIRKAPHYEDLPDTVKFSLAEEPAEVGDGLAANFRAYGEAVWELATAEAKKGMEPSIKAREKAAYEAGRTAVLR